MKQKINIVEASMKYRQIVIALVLVLMLVGVYALKNMPRNEFPNFTIRQGVIVGVFPGASSAEVEEQLTTVVENYIFGYKEVNKLKTYSHSKEGLMILYVELNDDITDADAFWSKLRHGLDELKMRLPSGVIALFGNNDFGDTSALLITMSSKDKTYRELEEIMKNLEADIRKINSVSKIKRYGTQKEEIYIYVQQEKLNEFHLKPAMIMASFNIHEALSYAGKLDNNELVLPVHLPAHYQSVEDIEQQIIYSDPEGNIIRIKDIARVERKYEEPINYIRNNGNNSLLLSLEMQQGNNIVQFGEDVQKIVNQFIATADGDLNINIISNQPEVVEESITHFLSEFIIAIISVIVVTMILLPFRVASVAAFTIPITILITMGIMLLFGIQLDIVSLAGLIVVLGMVVDNAIVVIDNHVEKLDSGETAWNAAWKAATELFIPVLSATAAIITAFVPLMFYLKGMASDFVGAFPLTITIALIISLLVAIFLVPFLCFMFIKQGLHNKTINHRKSLLDYVQTFYDKGLALAFRKPALTITFGIASIVIALLLFTQIEQRLFPAMDRKQFVVEVFLPEGSSVKATEKVLDSLEKALLLDERVTNVASFVGNGSPRFHTLFAPHMPAQNYGQILVNTVSNDATIEILTDYNEKYTNAFPNAHVKWKQIAMEAFVAPIEVRISGDDIATLKQKAEEVAAILRENENVTWVRNDWNEMREGISVELNENKVNQLGYAKSLVASSLMVALDGLPLTTIWEGDYPVDVILSKEDDEKNSINSLADQYVSSPLTLESLPLRSIATLNPEWTEGNITRRNGVRTITVQADVARGVTYASVFSDVKPVIDQLSQVEGVTIAYGGEHEETFKNYIPMGYSLITSVLLIFLILLFQFKTFKRALLIMSTMVLSLFGATLGLKLVGYPFSLTSFIGVIGLVGITVRNGIILIDYALQLVKEGNISIKEAAIAAGKRRMRPIFLTSMAAAMGVIPMIISKSPLWAPLGTVICFGLIFGMILTLYILPVLYWKTSHKEINTSVTNL